MRLRTRKLKPPPEKKIKNLNKKNNKYQYNSISISSSIHADSESENHFDNSTNDSAKESIDGKSTEIKHILNHGMSDNNIQNNLWKTWDTIFTIFPPVKEEHIKVKGYAIIYMGKEIPHTFIACLQKNVELILMGLLKQSNMRA